MSSLENTLQELDYLPELTNQEVAARFGRSMAQVSKCRAKVRHALAKDCTVNTGMFYENKVAQVLNRRGFTTELMTFRCPFDILVNGKVRIDVKVTTKTGNLVSMKSPVYIFSVRRGKRENCDFYACYIVPLDKLYIIPSEAIPDYKQLIHVSFSNHGGSKRRWHEYQDRFDLIEQFLAQP